MVWQPVTGRSHRHWAARTASVGAVVFAAIAIPRLTGSAYDACAWIDLGRAVHWSEHGEFAKHLKSSQVLAGIAERAGLRDPAGELAARIRVDGAGSLLKIHVRAFDPEEGLVVARLLVSEQIASMNEPLRTRADGLKRAEASFLRALARLRGDRSDARRRLRSWTSRFMALVSRRERLERRMLTREIQMLGRRADRYRAELARTRQARANLPDSIVRLAGIGVRPVSPWPRPVQRGLATCALAALTWVAFGALGTWQEASRTQGWRGQEAV